MGSMKLTEGERFMMTCPKCQQEMDRNNPGVARGWHCWDCDEFVEDEDDGGEDA